MANFKKYEDSEEEEKINNELDQDYQEGLGLYIVITYKLILNRRRAYSKEGEFQL